MRLWSAVIAVVVGVTASTARADDLCPEPAPLLADASVALTGLSTPAEDDALRVTGRLAPGATIDPATDGVTITLTSALAGTVLGARVLGGGGWTARSGGWQYHDPRGSVAGITRVTVKRAAVRPEAFAFAVQGRRGDWANALPGRPLALTIVFDATGRPAAPCGTAHFSLARCRSSHSGRALSCDPPRPPRRCAEHDANGTIRCAAVNAAAAEEAYFAAHGTYYSGQCAGLPNLVPSDAVSCVASGAQLAYSVTTASPTATTACVYSSSPSAGQPNLVCM